MRWTAWHVSLVPAQTSPLVSSYKQKPRRDGEVLNFKKAEASAVIEEILDRIGIAEIYRSEEIVAEFLVHSARERHLNDVGVCRILILALLISRDSTAALH
jgi:hypothetical protein